MDLFNRSNNIANINIIKQVFRLSMRLRNISDEHQKNLYIHAERA